MYLYINWNFSWWKVKVKDGDEESEGGLVPAAYVEEVFVTFTTIDRLVLKR